jgi:hypothetical protein
MLSSKYTMTASSLLENMQLGDGWVVGIQETRHGAFSRRVRTASAWIQTHVLSLHKFAAPQYFTRQRCVKTPLAGAGNARASDT